MAKGKQRPKQCMKCNGTGKHPAKKSKESWTYIDCKVCMGRGKVRQK